MSNLMFSNQQSFSSKNGNGARVPKYEFAESPPLPLPQSTRPPPSLEKPDGVFDVPPVSRLITDTNAKVSAVSPTWRSGMIGDKILAIQVPCDQPVLGLSKERFVDLLDFAEIQLGVSNVYAVFAKPDVSQTEGFVRTLRYVGFRPLAPSAHPEALPADKCFIMNYVV